MASFSSLLLTSFAKGELTPLLNSRHDLAAYFEGCSFAENWVLLRQGGLERRFGTRMIKEVKDSSKDTILLPFESSIEDAYAIELGDLYGRVYKNGVRMESPPGTAVEFAAPYDVNTIRQIHFAQSVDVQYLFHRAFQQRRLARISDTSWQMTATTFSPPPTTEDDFNYSGGTITLTPSATTGTITLTASAALFHFGGSAGAPSGDIGRIVVFGASRAVITAVTSATTATATVLDAFPNTSAIPAGQWFFRLAPRAALTVVSPSPVGAQTVLTTPIPSFRSQDVGRYVLGFGGVVRIASLDSTTQMRGEVVGEMTGTMPILSGNWTLESPAWSPTNGYPGTGDFIQGRLGQASTTSEPTTFWLSESDNYDSYAPGITADKSIRYTVATRQLNRIEWITENIDMFIGTSGAELRARGTTEDSPLGGDQIPFVSKFDNQGSLPVQPITSDQHIIFVDRTAQKIFMIGFDIEKDNFSATELTAIADHITKVDSVTGKYNPASAGGVRQGHIAMSRRPNPTLFFVLQNGQMAVLTFFLKEKVVGFTRWKTDGFFEAVCAVPAPAAKPDNVYVICRRIINGQTKRFVEVVDREAFVIDPDRRDWTNLNTDCAVVYQLAAATTTFAVPHLEGKTVTVVADGSHRGSFVVTGGSITLPDPAYYSCEIGLAYRSRYVSMEPAVQGRVTKGLPRQWRMAGLDLFRTRGGKINGERIEYSMDELDVCKMFTGNKIISNYADTDLEGRITVEQDDPYPMTLRGLFGEVYFGSNI